MVSILSVILISSNIVALVCLIYFSFKTLPTTLSPIIVIVSIAGLTLLILCIILLTTPTITRNTNATSSATSSAPTQSSSSTNNPYSSYTPRPTSSSSSRIELPPPPLLPTIRPQAEPTKPPVTITNTLFPIHPTSTPTSTLAGLPPKLDNCYNSNYNVLQNSVDNNTLWTLRFDNKEYDLYTFVTTIDSKKSQQLKNSSGDVLFTYTIADDIVSIKNLESGNTVYLTYQPDTKVYTNSYNDTLYSITCEPEKVTTKPTACVPLCCGQVDDRQLCGGGPCNTTLFNTLFSKDIYGNIYYGDGFRPPLFNGSWILQYLNPGPSGKIVKDEVNIVQKPQDGRFHVINNAGSDYFSFSYKDLTDDTLTLAGVPLYSLNGTYLFNKSTNQYVKDEQTKLYPKVCDR